MGIDIYSSAMVIMMDWKECVQLDEKFQIRSRFDWPVGEGRGGFDCNDAFTFNDVWGAIAWVWTWPGDYLLNIPGVKAFFELGPETIVGSSWSGALSWLALMLGVALMLPNR